MSSLLNTYKVKVEANVLAESESQARNAVFSALDNSSAVSSVTIEDMECKLVIENENAKNLSKEQQKLAKKANEEIEKMKKEGRFKTVQQVPDEVIVTNDDGSAKVVPNPQKAKLIEEINNPKKQEKEDVKQGIQETSKKEVNKPKTSSKEKR